MKELEYLQDFEYLYHALEVHPLLIQDEKNREFRQCYERLKCKIEDYISLIEAMTKLTMLFEDGHTNIELPYAKEDKCLRIICEWHDEMLVLKEAYKNIEAGAELVAIEGMMLKDIVEQAARVIPHENIYLVKSRMIEYPYKNYHIFSRMNLVRLFGFQGR